MEKWEIFDWWKLVTNSDKIKQNKFNFTNLDIVSHVKHHFVIIWKIELFKIVFLTQKNMMISHYKIDLVKYRYLNNILIRL